MASFPRIRSVKVTGLHGMFDYALEFPKDSNTIIVIAPNGYGKTAFLSLINSCLQFRLYEASKRSFTKLEIKFEDKTKWEFINSGNEKDRDIKDDYVDEYIRRSHNARLVRNHRRIPLSIKVNFYDAMGKPVKFKPPDGSTSVPVELLARALDRVLPVRRIDDDLFLDLRDNQRVTTSDLFEKYHLELMFNEEVESILGPYRQAVFGSSGHPINCVFIETQRLLQSKKVEKSEIGQSDTQEEVVRQSKSLAARLQQTFSDYAAISQDLERSFPNRLIERVQTAGPNNRSVNVSSLRAELDDVEAKRAALTAAGILVESGRPLRAPKDEYLNNVADALEIYVADSKIKLATFDDMYAKVSVFRELLAKKLKPKELTISRENGAEIRRGKIPLDLTGLSSGEKHEFIILFRLIFETPPGSLVLIDEPEISLHVVWQLEFMSDLQKIQSANNFQSIIATHSPQLIQGADSITVDLADQAQ